MKNNRINYGFNSPNSNKSKYDIWLNRIYQIIQIIVAGAVISSIFLVVIPVYQKEVLTEDLAKKEKDLRKIQLSIDSLNSLQESLNITLLLTNMKNDTLNYLLNNNKLKLIDLESMKNILLTKNRGLENHLNLKISELKDDKYKIIAGYLKEFMIHISTNYHTPRMDIMKYEIIVTENNIQSVKYLFDFHTYSLTAMKNTIRIIYTENEHLGESSIPKEILKSIKDYFLSELNKIDKLNNKDNNIIADKFKSESVKIENKYSKLFNETKEDYRLKILEYEKKIEYSKLGMEFDKDFFEYMRSDSDIIFDIVDDIVNRYYNNTENWLYLFNQ